MWLNAMSPGVVRRTPSALIRCCCSGVDWDQIEPSQYAPLPNPVPHVQRELP
ncbi:MAG: hypothetical protein V9E81_07165 [Marmoricola sp.]